MIRKEIWPQEYDPEINRRANETEMCEAAFNRAREARCKEINNITTEKTPSCDGCGKPVYVSPLGTEYHNCPWCGSDTEFDITKPTTTTANGGDLR